MAQTELSLFDLYNQLLQQQTKYGEKLDRIYDIFSGTMKFPDGVSNSNDSPGLWPDTGINVYAILSEYNLAEQFCTIGILFNIGSGRYKYQIMVVQEDELHPIKNGKIYYRYSKQSSNTWSEWKRNVYLYELTGGKDADGNKIKDDNGKDITDTEDEDPDTNPHNKNGDSSKTTFVTEKSHQSERLSTPRKIELTDLISGSAMFDGSGDIQIETTSKNVVPINVHVPADHPSYDTYRLLCTLPASALTMYDYVLITGHIGGWTTIDGKAYITICASNREGFVINGMSMGQAKDVDIVAYQLTNGEVKIYLKVNKNGWVDDSALSVYGNDQIKISGDAEPLDATSVQIWSLKENGILFDGKNITANLIGNAKTSILAQQSDSSMVVCNDNNRGYITATSQYGKYNQLFCNSGVMLDRVTGSVVANTFKGNLVGNADTSTESAYATSIKANFNVTTKGYLLAIVGDNKYTPFYDTGIYLTTNSGQMHINNLEADYIKANNIVTDALTTTNATISTLSISEKIVMNSRPIYFGTDGVSKLAYDGSMLHSYVDFTAPMVHNAIYNDYAEYFPRGENTEPGDVIVLDVESDKEQYIKSSENSECVIGVHSDSYGHIVGGVNAKDGQTREEANKDFIPVALAGRVRVNVVGKSRKGAKLVATDNGCARLYDKTTDDIDDIIGYLVESDDRTDKRRLNMKIK